jgi:RsiW-degrading membrane proteinase PrsW (M82 family)
MINDPKTLVIALVGGTIPSLLWLWFWLKEDNKKFEPNGLLILCFIMGMLAVLVVLPVEKYIKSLGLNTDLQTLLWAASEEIVKFLAVIIALYKLDYRKPICWPIYMVTAAVGFAALENAFFLIKPLSQSQNTVGLLTGQLRYLGATLLHTVASGTIGIAAGLSFYMESWKKGLYIFFGLLCAIALHTTFNFFIMKDNGTNLLLLKVFGSLWVVTIIILLLFEKLRRMSGEEE